MNDPKRLLAVDPESGSLAQLLLDAGERLKPGAGSSDELWRRLLPLLPPVAGSPGGGDSGAGGGALGGSGVAGGAGLGVGTAPGAVVAGLGVSWVKAIVLPFVFGGVLGVGAMGAVRGAGVEAPTEAVSPVARAAGPVVRREAPRALRAGVGPSVSELPSLAPIPSTLPVGEKEKAPPLSLVRPLRVSSPTAPAPALEREGSASAQGRMEPLGEATLGAEALSLVQARNALINQDPAQSLRLLEQSRLRFPAGALSDEREVLVLESLARSGRIAEARTRAVRFLATHPDSPLRSQISRFEKIEGVE